MSSKRSKELQIDICNDYSNEKISIEKLLQKYNLSPVSLYRILKKNNIEKRSFHSSCGNKLRVNENYFENINDENKAYWLGFITAKGHIYHTSENFARLQLTLPINDVDHLEKLRENLSAENKISIIKETCKISINSLKLCKDLENYRGLPKLDENLMPHYIRGTIDGSGSFSSKINFHFTSLSPDYISEFKNYLVEKCNLDSSGKVYFKNNKYHISFKGNEQVKNIFDYIYSLGFSSSLNSLKLNRKYELYKNYLI